MKIRILLLLALLPSVSKAPSTVLARMTIYQKEYFTLMPLRRADLIEWQTRTKFLENLDGSERALFLYDGRQSTREFRGRFQRYESDPRGERAFDRLIFASSDSEGTYVFPLESVAFMTVYPLSKKGNGPPPVPALPEGEDSEEALYLRAVNDYLELFRVNEPVVGDELSQLWFRKVITNQEGDVGRRAFLIASEKSPRGYRVLEGPARFVTRNRISVHCDSRSVVTDVEVDVDRIVGVTLRPIRDVRDGKKFDTVPALSYADALAQFPAKWNLACVRTLVRDAKYALWQKMTRGKGARR